MRSTRVSMIKVPDSTNAWGYYKPEFTPDLAGGWVLADDAEAEICELMEALKCLYALVQGECPSVLEDDHHDAMVRSAIAKAKGGQE